VTTALELDATRGRRAGQRVQRPARPLVPSIEQLLVEGGDGRIALDAAGGVNKYGCPPLPDAGLIALGSSTASVISGPAFAAAERLRYRLVQAAAVEPQAVTYARELQRIRGELLQLCGLADLSGLELVFGASGTDLHLIAGQLLGGSKALPGLAVMVDAVETGSCVPAALAGRHFSDRAALGETVSAGAAIASGPALEVVSVALRDDDGTPRPADSIDAEVTALVAGAAAAGRRVLLSLVDVSKTGMIAPSPDCALALRRRWPETVEVLIDACQFRIAPATLRAYLQHGFMVALTGSKFVTGPTFSGALLFPAAPARRYRGRLLPRALAAYSLRADWPQHWAAAGGLANSANFGLLLRWQAALEELRAFRAVPEAAVSAFLQNFGRAIRHRLAQDPLLEPLPVPRLERGLRTVEQSWDQLQTIFPFVMYRPGGRAAPRALNREETQRIYRQLQDDLSAQPEVTHGYTGDTLAAARYQLGQPVACGRRGGVPVSALRICASARLIVEATTGGGDRAARVLGRVTAALDKAALLV
jgi:hypothetical protein